MNIPGQFSGPVLDKHESDVFAIQVDPRDVQKLGLLQEYTISIRTGQDIFVNIRTARCSLCMSRGTDECWCDAWMAALRSRLPDLV